MTGRAGRAGRAGRVVVSVSGSLAGLAALRRGLVEARATGRPLLAVLAWEPPEGEALYRARPESSWADLWAEGAARRLDQALDDAFGGLPPEVRIERRVVRGAPGTVLCAVASDAADVLLVGTARSSRSPMGVHRRPVQRAVLAGAVCDLVIVGGPRLLPREARLLRRCRRRDVRPRARRKHG
ncbi:universal stress protein [Actinacidiphila glaucinigra]|uniref:universal stress protein n=1 Tax=Actinacidiphila glaucinigra TaxID=235986 RepID=UPI0037CBE860